MAVFSLFAGECDLGAAARVRGSLRSWADSLGMRERLRDDLALVASELVANAVEAGATVIEVQVRTHPRSMELRVNDNASGRPASQPVGLSSALRGRGLAIVAALTEEWGYDDIVDDGKTVWARVAF